MRPRTIKQGNQERISVFSFNANESRAFVQIVHGDLIDGGFVPFPVQNPEGYEITGAQFEQLVNNGFSEEKVWSLIDEMRAAALINYTGA